MGIGLAIFLVIDTVLAVTAMALLRSRRAESEEGTPISTAMLWCLGALLLHGVGVGVYSAYEVLIEGGASAGLRLNVLFVSAATGLVPALLFAWLFISAWSSGITNAVVGSPRGLTVGALDTARRLTSEGDIDGALAEYRRVADENPHTPEPLLAAEGLLEVAKRHADAVALCREIMDRHERDMGAWSRAAQRLVRLYRGPLEDPEAASALEHKMAAKQPKAAPGKSNGGAMAGKARRHSGTPTDEAVEELRQRHKKNPTAARPLFEAATLLERDERYKDAADMLREITRGYRGDDRVWCEAAHRLVGLMTNHLADQEAAVHLLRQIFKRAPRSELGRLAYEQLKDRQKGD